MPAFCPISRRAFLALIALVCATVLPPNVLAADEFSTEQLDFFESKIRPILVEHCYECHSHESGESSGDLFLDSRQAVLQGGSLGPSIKLGNPDASILLIAVRYQHAQLQMPPTEKLDDQSIDYLAQWVAMGAPDPRQPPSADVPVSPTEQDPQSHWAFIPPESADGEFAVEDSDVERIDSIARTVAQHAGLAVADRCSDSQLIRRLYHDLTGLLPTESQIARYERSTRVDKTERLVDSLLASPEFGERFARYWMDVARYADTVGYALGGKPRRLTGSERYRDWLIRAFATDLPYDEMIRLQLAADRHDPENKRGHMDAMGFLTVGRRYLNRLDIIDDRIDVVTRGLLGMTVTCARCHDHKFDPIPTQDYYSLVGIFQSSELKADGPSPLMMVDKANPSDTHVLVRGQPFRKGELAPRQFLSALRAEDEPRFSDGSGRVELAERIVDRRNPLVARVLVNRIWAKLIGRPIVDTTSDFGFRTEPPPLVGLLDELSTDFTQDWSIKRLVRRIVLSRIYAEDSSGGISEIDPENRIAAKGNRRRRDFESMRDAMLQSCGWLDRSIGGEPVEIHLGQPSPRRTVYAMVDRQNLPSLFRTFDVASPDAHTPKRFFTTVPQQALFLMNHPQIGTLAASLSQQIRETHTSGDQQVEALFSAIYSRSPSGEERDACTEFLNRPLQEKAARYVPQRAWKYGTATLGDDSAVNNFQPLAHFNGTRWQAEAKFPAENGLGYAYWDSENGHPGSQHAVVKRWVAPTSGVANISGSVGHLSDKGDGVELAIWVGNQRIWSENQKKNRRPFSGLRHPIQQGESVDFVVSPRGSSSHDTFRLHGVISLVGKDGRIFEADSKRDFSGPIDPKQGQSLDRLAQLAQTLLLSNEFLFVD